MPVLFQINVTANWGSHGRIAEEIGEMAMTQGWDSYIAYGRYANPSKSHLLKVGSPFGHYLHGLQSMLFDRHGLGSTSATWKLIREIEWIRPDIIHLHNIHGYYLNYPILFQYLSEMKTPVVWTLHDCWPITGHCAFFTYADCDRWKNGCHHCPCQKNYPTSLLMDRSETNYELKRRSFTSLSNLTLVPVSEWLDGLLDESFLKDVPRRCIHNGIDTDVFHADSSFSSFCQGKKVVLGVSNMWEPRKGMKDFLALRSLLSSDYVIVLIGLSKKQIYSLPEGIIGIERTDNLQQLVHYYSRADVFVNPTYEDNFPTTNLEALSCGTPVVTYRTGGSPEAVDEETGVVVPCGDVNSLAENIEAICCAPYPETRSERCRQRVTENFCKRDRYQEYLALYNSLL